MATSQNCLCIFLLSSDVHIVSVRMSISVSKNDAGPMTVVSFLRCLKLKPCDFACSVGLLLSDDSTAFHIFVLSGKQVSRLVRHLSLKFLFPAAFILGHIR
jgi:hypothetical protein